jgi:hypothetical protein
VLHEYCIEFLEDHPALDAVMASKDGMFLEHVAKSFPELLKDVCVDWCQDNSIKTICFPRCFLVSCVLCDEEFLCMMSFDHNIYHVQLVLTIDILLICHRILWFI